MLFRSRDGDAIVGVLPLTLVHSPLFGRALVSSGFAVDGGILAEDRLTVQRLADVCWQGAERMCCPTAELRGGAFPSSGWTMKSGAYLGFAKQLEADDDAQLLAIPRKHRAEVRKGLDNDLVVEVGNDDELLDIH